MTTEEKIEKMWRYLVYDSKLAVAIALKEDAIRRQDFDYASIQRSIEISVREAGRGLVIEMANSDQEAQVSDTTKAE